MEGDNSNSIFPSHLWSVVPHHLKLLMLKLLAFRWRKGSYKLKDILTLLSFMLPWVIPVGGGGMSVEKMMEMISLSIGDGRSQTLSHQSACPTNTISAVMLQNRNRVRWAGSWGHCLWQWQLLTENEWLTLNARWFSDCWLNTDSSLDGWTLEDKNSHRLRHWSLDFPWGDIHWRLCEP